jgi:methyl-accepting chemotaxis protein
MTRLREYIYGAGQIDVETVANHHDCEIGRWLFGEGSQHRDLLEYQHARDLHAAVHRRAAKVVNLVDRGRRLEAAADLAAGGELRALSGALAQAFNRLNKRLMETERGSLSA